MKKLIVFMLCIALALSLGLPVFAAEDRIISSGTCGDNLTWTLDSEGTLVISGTGDMWDFEYEGAPWYSERLQIKKAIIENGINNIADCAFLECTDLTEVEIPVSIIFIGDLAFNRCNELTVVDIPDGVKEIGSYAFSGCGNLTSIEIPDGIKCMESGTFSGCYALASIRLPDDLPDVVNMNFYDTAYYKNEENWKDNVLYIDKHLVGVKNIENDNDNYIWAPKDDTGKYKIKDVTGKYRIKEGTVSIAKYAFAGAINMTDIEIPDSVKYIGYDAFTDSGYYNDEKNWENGLLYIGNHLVAADAEISGDVKIKEGTLTVADGAFSSCENIETIEIPQSVKILSEEAFGNNLKEIKVHKENKYYTDINGVLFNKEGTRLIKYPGKSEAETYKVPDGVKEIGDWSFEDCANLKIVELPKSLEKIGEFPFDKSDNITDVYYAGSEADWNNIFWDVWDMKLTEDFKYGRFGIIYDAAIHFAINVTLDGNYITFDQMPIIENGRTLVPLRAIFEALGAEVNWIAEESKVVANKDSTTVSIKIGENKMLVNGEEKELDVPAKIINGRTLVPVRAISEAFKCNVSWDGEARTVIITK